MIINYEIIANDKVGASLLGDLRKLLCELQELYLLNIRPGDEACYS
jgi:hypothetical protein